MAWLSTAKPLPLHRLPGKWVAPSAPEDTIIRGKRYATKRKSTYRPADRYGDPYSNKSSKSPLLLGNPSNISRDVQADSAHENYTIQEKIGDVDYRPPATMTFDEYQKYKNREMMENYWRTKAAGPLGERQDSKKDGVKSLKIPVRGLEGPFGSNFVDIKPNGLVTLDFGGRWQRVNNPVIPVRSQRNGGFEFDQQISMNVIGKIGEKLKITANWDTKATFEFQNNIKLEYTGFQEDIIQKIEAGYVSMPINSALISGAQNLFGIKTKLQFGRLSVTSVISSQRGKVDQVSLPGGSQARNFEIKASTYEENRHFFLSQFFRNNYERSLKNLPVVASGVTITRVNVYLTNRINNTTTNKNIIAFMDLGEATPYHRQLSNSAANAINAPADDNANRLTSELRLYDPTNAAIRTPSAAGQFISTNIASLLGSCDTCFASGVDYTIITSARQLLPSEFSFNPQLGYISLNTPLTAQDFVAVSYEYTFTDPNSGLNKKYKVGELAGDVTADSSRQMVILKMLKPIGTKPALPTWNLMMKNIYQLGATQISRENFQMRIIYKDDSTGMDTPFLQIPGAGTIGKKSLLSLFHMDQLNPNNDPPADGNFDYIEGVTIDSKYGRLIFPTLEPFGQGLDTVLPTEELKNKYVFSSLYRQQMADVSRDASKNKFFLKGKYQSSSTSDIMLPGINIAPGSVTVMAGSNVLTEGTDYTIDYNLGRVKIINDGVMASGQEITIKYEKQDLFNFRRKTFIGSRFDYKVSNDINIGATILHQTEAPQITRTNIGDEPSSNTIWGMDANFKKDSRFITKLIDKLPIVQTKVPSSITFGGEFAQLLPGHPKVVDKGEGGTSFIDDFEGAETPYDLTRTPSRWKVGAMPRISNTKLNNGEIATLQNQYRSNGLENSYYRGKLAWYNIDYLFYGGSIKTVGIKSPDYTNRFVKAINTKDIFPAYQITQGQLPETTLDLAYFPSERGPYNYNPELDQNGNLPDPRMSWGAMTRDLKNDIDFDNANIQYIEFWMMNPYTSVPQADLPKDRIPIWNEGIDATKDATERNKLPDPVKSSGRLYFNLGDISEDVLKDKEHSFENGLPVEGRSNTALAKPTPWAEVPTAQYINNAFESSLGARSSQDIGWDGLNDVGEAGYDAYNNFVQSVRTRVTNTGARDAILADPSADNFNYYLGPYMDDQSASILLRYKNYNGLENNSPESTNNLFTPSNTNIPDNEDLNQDNTLTFDDNYYEYSIDIDPKKFVIGQNYIVGSTKGKDSVEYLQFRIPIRSPTDTVGSISDYKSLRFLRMYLNGFQEPIVLRFARLQLVANQWRVFSRKSNFVNPVQTIGGNAPGEDHGTTTVSTVNIEENSGTPSTQFTSRYVIPPGFTRDQDITSQINRQLNEQSLKLCVDNMEGKFYGSVFKSVNLNMLNYKRIRMFLHAESSDNENYLKKGDLIAFLRIGTDYTENYYEIEVPLAFTRETMNLPQDIWKSENNLNIDLHALTELKAKRNGEGLFSVINAYSGIVDGRKINIKGSPDLSAVQVLMIGILNPGNNEHTACIWADELRLTEFVQDAGWATTGRMNLKLADLANITMTGRYTGIGFGSLDQKVSQRTTVATGAYGIQGNMGLEKFLPSSLGLRLPFFASFNKQIISPKYNPLDPDVLLSSSLANIKNDTVRERYKKLVIDQQTIRSINLTNIQKVKTKPDAKSHFYDIENLTLSLGLNETKRTNSQLKNYTNKIYNAGVGYSFNNQSKPIEPFKNIKWLKSPYLKLIKDFNFTLLPTSFNFRADLNRRITTTQYWEGNPADGISQEPLYEKAFTFIRNYGMVWNLTKSITLNYSAITNAIIDEPYGNPDSTGYNKVLWKNVKNLGRTKNFTQSVGATYKVPLDKLPLTDWLNADLSYNGTYNWTAGAISQRAEFGNLILQNSRDLGINGRVSLDKLYSKVKFLKEVNNPAPKPKPTALNPSGKKDTSKVEPKPELKGLKAALRVVMSVKSINFSYKVTEGTKIAGYKGDANVLGVEKGRDSYYYGYMLPFAFGWQDPNIRFKLWDDSLIAHTRRLNDQFQYNRGENFTASTQLEPFREFIIKLNVARNKTSNYNELFHISSSDPQQLQYQQDAPSKTGMYNVSIIAIGSSFLGGNANDPTSSKVYDRFVASRQVFRRKLILQNNIQSDTLYGLNSQDVLIPAFIAAYTGKEPSKAKLSPFPAIPLPNWNISFTGLTRLPAIKKIFTSVNITHSYLSNFSISNYTSSLTYSESTDKINIYNDPSKIIAPDSVRNGTLVPIYNMDVVSIKESFSPLVGLNLKTKGKASYNIQYLRDRSMVLSMSNAQMQETSSSGLTVGFAWTKANFKVPFKWQGRAIPPLKNELQFKADLTVRDNKTVQRIIGGISTITAGTTTIQFRPTINYMISQRVNLTFYFDRQVTIPRISSSFRRGVTSFGIQLKFTLS